MATAMASPGDLCGNGKPARNGRRADFETRMRALKDRQMAVEMTPEGYETVLVHRATVPLLARYLSPEISFVWILSHSPTAPYGFQMFTAPLNRDENITGQMRALTYDLQLTTAEFLTKADAFADSHLNLIQSSSPMPDRLALDRIPEHQQARVLIKNGAFLRISLPHSYETARVDCFQRGYLASVLTRETRANALN